MGPRADPHRSPRRPRRPQTPRRHRHARPVRRAPPRPRPARPALLAGLLSAVALGLGTALVYPALIASVSDHAHPAWRANALGTYRFWRDIGYAAGALAAGLLADLLGLNATVLAAALLTAASGLLAARWITDHHPDPAERGR
ncbi:MFS transporter [Streptomyces diastatochromogenes]|nr:MFS transporter [Streptomyces diastatochromogenes]